jgi:hypothetical protein
VAIDERLASSQYEPYCREGHGADQALKDLSFHLSAYMSASSNLGRLLVVDWASSHGPWDDMLAFIFDGGVLSADHQRQIHLSDSERDAYGSATSRKPPSCYYRMSGAGLNRRSSRVALLSGTTAYLHDGRQT